MALIKLSASQIRELDERRFDRIGLENQYHMAMQYHANRTAELAKADAKWWDEVIEQHDLNPLKEWKLSSFEGAVCIVEKEKKED